MSPTNSDTNGLLWFVWGLESTKNIMTSVNTVPVHTAATMAQIINTFLDSLHDEIPIALSTVIQITICKTSTRTAGPPPVLISKRAFYHAGEERAPVDQYIPQIYHGLDKKALVEYDMESKSAARTV